MDEREGKTKRERGEMREGDKRKRGENRGRIG